MRLQSIKYVEYEGTVQEWRLEELILGERNLIVGKNAAGKSRAINIINALAQNLSGLRPPGLSANYEVNFSDDSRTIKYETEYAEGQVLEERVWIDEKLLLNRGVKGEGTIRAEEIDGGKDIRFQTPPGELAAFARRDNIQHKFLEPLFSWASSVRHYNFGSTLGKDCLAMFLERGGHKPDDRDQNAVVGLFRQGEQEFQHEFTNAIIEQMRELDYPIKDIGLKTPVSLRLYAPATSEPVGIYVQEQDLSGITDQLSMSQGMFRALSILVQVTYARMAKKATCVLIDDIGEGLDFDRSCRLIDLLRHQAKESKIQLIMSTNDRFVMNRVPLEEWSVLRRHGNYVQVKNYHNSRVIFDEFKFTGLSNFDFLATDFLEEEEVQTVP